MAWIISASATACSGPAPPKPISVKLRGSMPLATELALIASAMLLLTILQNAERRIDRAHGQLVGDVRRRSPARASAWLDLQVAAEELLGVEPAQHHLRIGHRRLGAALAVAGRAGIRAGRARADAERVARVDIGDRAAAGADRVDIDHRHQHRQLRDLGIARVLDPQLAVLDHADVGGGAADVDGDDVLRAARLAGPAPADHAAGGAGEQQADRPLRAFSTVEMPPFDCIMRTAARTPASRQPPLQVAADRRRCAARYRRSSRRRRTARTRASRSPPPRRCRHRRRAARAGRSRRRCCSCSSLRKLNRKPTITASSPRLANSSAARSDFVDRERHLDAAVGRHDAVR